MTNCQTCESLNDAATKAATAYTEKAAMRNKACAAAPVGQSCIGLTRECNGLKADSDAANAAWQNHFNSHPKAVAVP